MVNPGRRKCLHRGQAPFLAEVPRVIVAKAHDVETRCNEVFDVT